MDTKVSTIIALYKEVPEMTIKLTLSDLFEFGDELIRNSIKTATQVTQKKEETLITIDAAARLLGVDRSSLWRWNKSEYLVPIEVGGKRKYRLSEIKRILEGK